MKRHIAKGMNHLGNVHIIKLTDGSFVAVRRHEGAIAVLRKLFRSTPTLEEVLNVPTAFFGHTVETCFKDGSWPKIGKWPNIRKDQFRDPPTYTEDILSPGRFNILGGRDMVRGTVRDTIGLDPFVMDVDPEDFIKRIEKKVEFGIIEP